MKKVLVIGLVTLALAAPALAQEENIPSGVGARVACGAGECFVPVFNYLGEVIRYSGAGVSSALRVEIGDCCVAGDKYAVQLTSGGHRATTQTSHVVGDTCTTAWSSAAFASIYTTAATAKAQLKRLKTVSARAAAYIRFSSGSWVQTQGEDSCGY